MAASSFNNNSPNPEALRMNLRDMEDDDSDSMPELEDIQLKENDDDDDESLSSKTKYDLNDLSLKKNKSTKNGGGEDFLSELDPEGYEDILGSGRLKRKILTEGIDQTRPHTGDHVTIELTGRFQDEILLATHKLEFVLSEAEVIKALDLVVPLMHKGEIDQVIAESDFVYGDSGLEPDIPGKITLTLTVKLISFVSPGDINALPIPKRKAIGLRKKERGNFWISRSDYSQAIQCYRKAAEYFDDDKIELEVPADRYLLSQELQELITERVKTYNNLAFAQMKIEAYDSALASLRQVLQIEPNNEKGLFRKAKIFIEKGKDDEALGLLKRLTRLYEGNEQASVELNRLLAKRKQHKSNAEKLSKKMLGLDKYEKSKAEEASKRFKRNTSMLIGAAISTLIGLTAIFFYKN